MVALLFALFSTPNYWPNFLGTYTISNWSCESTTRDPGCLDSATVRIYEADGITNIDVLNRSGQVIRSNELKEKGNAHTNSVFGGAPEAPTFTVESKDSRGKRYFYNQFEITRTGFIHVQESELAGLNQSFRRTFTFTHR